MCAPACAQMQLMCYANGMPVDFRSAWRRLSSSARSTGEILQDSTRSAMVRRCARRRRQLPMSSAGEAPGAGASPVRSLGSALALHPSAHVAAMGRPIGGGLREAGCIARWRARLRPRTIDPELARRSIAREVEPATVTDQGVERREESPRMPGAPPRTAARRTGIGCSDRVRPGTSRPRCRGCRRRRRGRWWIARRWSARAYRPVPTGSVSTGPDCPSDVTCRSYMSRTIANRVRDV